MITKWLKRVLIVMICACFIGGFVFGKDVVSYFRCSARSVQDAVKSSVPTEFELRRARDLIDEIIPEMHANIKLIAQEEVEIAALENDIELSANNIEKEQENILKISGMLNNRQLASYEVGRMEFTREQLKEDLSRRFDHFKEAQVVLQGKKKLLEARQKSLHSAMQMLESTKSQKLLLAQKIESLASKHRLLQASAAGSQIEFDNNKIAQTEKLISQIQKRLDVAERVLAHESKFVQPLPLDSVDETDLLAEVDEYFNPTDGDPDQPEPLISRADGN